MGLPCEAISLDDYVVIVREVILLGDNTIALEDF
jgi:hypothetical protein